MKETAPHPALYLAWLKNVRSDNAKCPGQRQDLVMLLGLSAC